MPRAPERRSYPQASGGNVARVVAAAIPAAGIVDHLIDAHNVLVIAADPVTILNVEPVGVAAAIARLKSG